MKLLPKLPDESIDLVVTDPPYNVTDFSWDNLNNFKRFTETWFKETFRVLKNNAFMLVFWSEKHLKIGFEIFNPSRILIWHHSNLTQTGLNGEFVYDVNFIFLIKKGNAKIKRGKHSVLFNYSKPQSNFRKDKAYHPAQKPLELIKKLVYLCSNENDIVLDPFLGSGTTMRACLELKRNCIGIEINPEYIKIIKKRLNWGSSLGNVKFRFLKNAFEDVVE
ncbi:MAG: DNA-methyltransferase [Candidatus Helarchaeota archaeon]